MRRGTLGSSATNRISNGSRGGSSGRGGRSLDRFDKNNDGKIVPDELPSVLRKRHMRRYDKNNDGVIDAEEMKG